MADDSGTSEKDPAIERLDLTDRVREAAYQLKKTHPSVVFTSGRRSKEDQARAMAANVLLDRKFIEKTYKLSGLRTSCQQWIDTHPEKTTQAEIAQGLLSVLNTVSSADLANFSKHLAGEAFDVQPVEQNAEAIKKTIRELPGLSLFLDREGGLVRWHAEF